MKYRQLADTGVFVSELCLGAMTFGGRGGMWEVITGLDQDGVNTIVHRSLDAGINFIDTANVYAAGESETMLGRALAGRRHEVVLATKARGRMGKGPNDVGLSRLHIMQAVEASLRRLNTDYIDLYQVHRFDALTSLEDTMRALDDLVRSGKVRYIGCSNFSGWHLMKSLAVSDRYGWARYVAHQAYYSLIASGRNAWYPHYNAGKRQMKDGDFLLMDFAPDVGYYMSDVTRILDQIHEGNAQAAEQLLPLVYDELRKLAAAKLGKEKPGQTLQATALVHEAYLRLVDGNAQEKWENRGHFFSAAAESMRRLLVENARRKQRQRHGGEFEQLPLVGNEANIVPPVDMIEIGRAHV